MWVEVVLVIRFNLLAALSVDFLFTLRQVPIERGILARSVGRDGADGSMPTRLDFVGNASSGTQRALPLQRDPMHRSLGEKIVDVKFLKRGVDRELSFEMVQNMFLSIEICKSEFSFVSVCWVF